MRNLAIESIALLGAAFLTACAATTTPRTDEGFGESVTILKAQQVMRPEASRNTDPVKGLDGPSARGALDNYRKSFQKPSAGPASSITIGVGSGTGTAASK